MPLDLELLQSSLISSFLTLLESSGMLLMWSMLSNHVQFKKGLIPVSIITAIFGVLVYLRWDLLGGPLLVLVLFLITCHVFKRDYRSEVLEFFTGIFIYTTIEFILGYLFQTLLKVNTDTAVISIAINIVAIAGIILIKKRVPTQEYFKQLKANKYSKYIICTFMVVLLGVLVAWRYERELGEHYLLLLAVTSSLIVGINYIILLKSSQVELKDKELKVYEDYMPVISDLVDEVRAQQHDYKNHLNAIYMMVLEEEYDALKRYAEDYIDLTRFHNKLMAIDDKIITGVIYSKLCEAEKYDIQLKFEMDHLLPNYPIEKYELVGLLGNLLDNAVEANMHTKIKNPFVELKIYEKDDCAYLEVTNTFHGAIDTVHMFDKGFSSKGENRGYGLYNIKKLVNAHNGVIQVEKRDLLTIRIEFKIKK
ncbi:sensor histidine kinase [Vallitalea okinawensis]|uniref:sensor histidine kinase n=1 Tax=Vallitalea okinawensis TaxID=2078660 RepID=UPI000CFAEF32|nr:GHKL domain-containing protein [Vallitalea okinawensis]